MCHQLVHTLTISDAHPCHLGQRQKPEVSWNRSSLVSAKPLCFVKFIPTRGSVEGSMSGGNSCVISKISKCCASSPVELMTTLGGSWWRPQDRPGSCWVINAPAMMRKEMKEYQTHYTYLPLLSNPLIAYTYTIGSATKPASIRSDHDRQAARFFDTGHIHNCWGGEIPASINGPVYKLWCTISQNGSCLQGKPHNYFAVSWGTPFMNLPISLHGWITLLLVLASLTPRPKKKSPYHDEPSLKADHHWHQPCSTLL